MQNNDNLSINNPELEVIQINGISVLRHKDDPRPTMELMPPAPLENMEAIQAEVKEIAERYLDIGQLESDGDYVENSQVVDSSIEIEVRNKKITAFYFNKSMAIHYSPGPVEYESVLSHMPTTDNGNIVVKPLLTFGYGAYLVTAHADTTYEFDLDDKGAYAPGIYYYLSGRSQITIKSTGEKLLERTAGWLNTEHTDYASVGNEKATNYFPKETKWICIPHKINPNGLPNVSKLIIPAGTTQTILNGSNILICEGKLISNNIIFTGPSRFRSRDGDVSVSAITDVYALIFN